ARHPPWAPRRRRRACSRGSLRRRRGARRAAGGDRRGSASAYSVRYAGVGSETVSALPPPGRVASRRVTASCTRSTKSGAMASVSATLQKSPWLVNGSSAPGPAGPARRCGPAGRVLSARHADRGPRRGRGADRRGGERRARHHGAGAGGGPARGGPARSRGPGRAARPLRPQPAGGGAPARHARHRGRGGGARARLRRAGGCAPGSPARVLGRALDDGRGGARTPRGGREPAAAARGRRQGGRDAHPPGLPRAPAVIRLLAAGAVLAAAAAVVAFVLVLRAPGPPRPTPVTVTLEDGERFADAAEDLRPAGAEGYLFPDTYQFPLATPQERILRTMVHRFREVFGPSLTRRAAAQGLTEEEAVTLASLVEEEAARPEERRLVAAV